MYIVAEVHMDCGGYWNDSWIFATEQEAIAFAEDCAESYDVGGGRVCFVVFSAQLVRRVKAQGA